MRRFLRCLSPRHYPRSAYVLFWLAPVVWVVSGVWAEARHLPYCSCWWLPFVRDMLFAAAAISNSFSPKFQTAQRIWAGRTHWIVLLAAAPSLVFLIGNIATDTKPEWYSWWEWWLASVFFSLSLACLCHGLVVHIFTCPEDPTPMPARLRTPVFLRVLAWAGFLGAWFGYGAYDYGGWDRAEAAPLMTFSLAVFVLAHVLGGALLHFRRSSAPEEPSTPAAASVVPGRLTGFALEVRVRGVALIVFWVGAFLMWLAVNTIPVQAESWRLSSLGLAGLMLVFVGGGLTLLMPHPASRRIGEPSDERATLSAESQPTLPSDQ